MLQVRVLGTAAGGGVPQWNCNCAGCRAARSGQISCRRHSCAAVSGDGKRWYLLNAPPDVATQIEDTAELHAGPGVRQSPIAGVILTDAELDHTLGLLVLRENSHLEVFAAACVLAALETSFPVRNILRSYNNVRWRTIEPGRMFKLSETDLHVRWIGAGKKRPRYVRVADSEDWVGALEIRCSQASLFYAPAVEQMTAEIHECIKSAGASLVDGTFLHADEMQVTTGQGKTAWQMGHVPLQGEQGLLAALPEAALQKIFLTHINNTNPTLLLENQQQYPRLAYDGMILNLCSQREES